MERAKTLNNQDVVKNVELKNLKCSLRKHKKDGVNWLRFLENRGFCGILADEMGLGKRFKLCLASAIEVRKIKKNYQL